MVGGAATPPIASSPEGVRCAVADQSGESSAFASPGRMSHGGASGLSSTGNTSRGNLHVL